MAEFTLGPSAPAGPNKFATLADFAAGYTGTSTEADTLTVYGVVTDSGADININRDLAGHAFVVTGAPGQRTYDLGFDPTTDAIFPDAGNGVATISHSASRHHWPRGTTFQGFQYLKTDSGAEVAIFDQNFTTALSYVDRCIIGLLAAGADGAGVRFNYGAVITNSLIRVRGRPIDLGVTGASQILSCYLESLGGLNGVDHGYGGSILARNNVFVGVADEFNLVDGAAPTFTASNNATTNATLPEGSANITSLVTADAFVDPASDLRLNLGSALIDAATASDIPAMDLIGQTRSATHDIGPLQYAAAGGGPSDIARGVRSRAPRRP